MSNPWIDLPEEFHAGVDPAHPESSDTATHMERFRSIRHGEAYLAWSRYQSIVTVYDQLVVNTSGGFFIDRYGEMVTRVCREDAITRYRADQWVGEALALRERLPKVLTTLRDGILSRQLVQTVLARTDLISDDAVIADLDTEIERNLRTSKAPGPNANCGTWSIASSSVTIPTPYANGVAKPWTSAVCGPTTSSTVPARSPVSWPPRTSASPRKR
ncbi:protein of unknown function [Gordonia westfalica]|uniref:DUF222 domain-containing protein n=1 Tax=Gordonia westfalica TaxID=158898 RepID=A0A1H2KSU5_9ACTN|nr:protein of unknown function [Gordonia westfalica]